MNTIEKEIQQMDIAIDYLIYITIVINEIENEN